MSSLRGMQDVQSLNPGPTPSKPLPLPPAGAGGRGDQQRDDGSAESGKQLEVKLMMCPPILSLELESLPPQTLKPLPHTPLGGGGR